MAEYQQQKNDKDRIRAELREYLEKNRSMENQVFQQKCLTDEIEVMKNNLQTKN